MISEAPGIPCNAPQSIRILTSRLPTGIRMRKQSPKMLLYMRTDMCPGLAACFVRVGLLLLPVFAETRPFRTRSLVLLFACETDRFTAFFAFAVFVLFAI